MVTRWRWPPDSSPGEVVGPVRQAHLVEEVEGAAAGLRGAYARDEQGHLHVLHGPEHGEEVVELEDEPHASGPVVAAVVVGKVVEDLAVDDHLAAVDLVEAGEAVEERGLAAAAGAHDGDDLAAGHVQVHPLEGVHLDDAGAVGLLEVGGGDDEVVHACHAIILQMPSVLRA